MKNKFDELTNVLEITEPKVEEVKEEIKEEVKEELKIEEKKEKQVKEEVKVEEVKKEEKEEPDDDDTLNGLSKLGNKGKKEEVKKEEKFEKETTELTIDDDKKEVVKEEKKEKLTVDDITTDDILSVVDIKFEDKLTKDEKLKLVKDKLESYKQKTEVDVSKFDPESQQLIKFLENKGSVRDFVEPLKQFDDFLQLSSEERIKQVYLKEGIKADKIEEMLKDTDLAAKELHDYYVNDMGKTKAQATELIDELVTDGTLLDEHHKVLDNIYVDAIKEARTAKYNDIVKTYNEKVTQYQEKDKIQAVEERKALNELIDKTEEFQGLKIPVATREYMKSQVENGEFMKFLNNPQAQLEAFLMTKFKSKIETHKKEQLEKENRKGYNKGIESKTRDLHNIPKSEESLGHDVHKESKPLSGFLEIL